MPGRWAGLAARAGEVESLTSKLNALGPAAEASGARIGQAMSSSQAAITKTQTAVDKLNASLAGGVPDTAKGYETQQLGLLENLAKLLTQFGGEDAGGKFGFVTILKDQMEKVQKQQTTIFQAIQTLQKQFGSVYGPIQKRLLATKDPAERAFLQYLLQFINSGSLTGFK